MTAACAPGARALQQETPRLVQLEEACSQQRGPNAARNKVLTKKKNLSCNAGDTGPIPDQGAKIPHASGDSQKKKGRKEKKNLTSASNQVCPRIHSAFLIR